MSFLRSVSYQISNLGKFWQEKINSQIFRWNLILIVFQLTYLIYKFYELPRQVPLYYSLPWGEARLTHASNLFLLPTFSIIVGLVNNLSASLLFNYHRLFSRLFVVFSLVFSLLSAISLFHIINLIT
jgi:hypothetical protein